MTIKIQILKETTGLSSRTLLHEIKFADVLKTIGSKADLKKIYQMEMKFLEKYKEHIRQYTPEELNQRIKGRVEQLKQFLRMSIPTDIDDNQKGTAAIWIKNQVFSSLDIYEWLVGGSIDDSYEILHLVEHFFKMQRFITGPTEKNEYRDLLRVPTLGTLQKITDEAIPAYEEYYAQKNYKDASQGTEVIYEDNEFKIFIPNNKGAACELGKGTEWCTAAPGLDYYEDYHKPDDPLFIIYVKHGEAITKYQFHYGSSQFMNSKDVPIGEEKGGKELFKKIHHILVNTVGDRFPFLKNSMIETDKGVSVKHIDRTSDCEECPSYKLIRYIDILTGNTYGGEHPARTKIFDEGGHYEVSFDWSFTENNKTGYPLKAFIDLQSGKPELTACYWYVRSPQQTYQIAVYQNSGLKSDGIKLDSGNIFRYLIDYGEFPKGSSEEIFENAKQKVWMENGGQFFKQNIEPNPNAFGQSLFDKYVPDEVKQEIAQKQADKLPPPEDSEEITETETEEPIHVGHRGRPLQPGPYYHGSSTALGIESLLLPPTETGIQTEPRGQRTGKVFFTNNLESAKYYAGIAVKKWGGKPIIYLVEPIGNIKQMTSRVDKHGPIFTAAKANVKKYNELGECVMSSKPILKIKVDH